VCDKVPILYAESMQDDRKDFVEVCNLERPAGRRKGNGQAMHNDVRHATQMVSRKAIAIEKAALIGDERGTARNATWR